MKVKAVKLVRYGRQQYRPGESFEVEERYARVLMATGHIQEDSESASVRPARRRRYKRRDMTAEGSAVTAEGSQT